MRENEKTNVMVGFQSTPPSREATCRFDQPAHLNPRFNPRPPHGRRPAGANVDRGGGVSIHAPLTGGDLLARMLTEAAVFQSTPPSREATTTSCRRWLPGRVSIHAPLTGGDICAVGRWIQPGAFQSTPPSREATTTSCRRWLPGRVSIHAPLTGGDVNIISFLTPASSFNPRPPHGRRRRHPVGDGCQDAFQSTPPSREATCRIRHRSSVHHGFNPRPPHGRRLDVGSPACNPHPFQSTPPSREATIRATSVT